MALKTKTSLTRAVRKKIKKENAKRAKGMKEAKEEHSKKGGEKKAKRGGERREEVTKEVEVGDMCLMIDKEIAKWHRATYPTTTISEGNQRNCTRDEGRSLLTNHCGNGPTRGRRGLFGRPVGTSKLVCYSHRVSNNSA